MLLMGTGERVGGNASRKLELGARNGVCALGGESGIFLPFSSGPADMHCCYQLLRKSCCVFVTSESAFAIFDPISTHNVMFVFKKKLKEEIPGGKIKA